ncbi:MAG: CBS domain-containing protein [Synergistaceae bacterium]|jgi:tRNA nucleotidyltransferase (CCA-adding enzyme)|nr:CBS domain-containing protein [Synergistaceae bacterium]
MQLITSHLNTDFDSLASMVAVRKLYPEAVICPPGSMNRRVRDFVNRHGHGWNIMKPSKIPLEQVTLMVVVDTRSRLRIGPFAALAGRQEVEVHVYDHHPPTIDDIPANVAHCESIGATTTMIVERLSRERKRVSREEASLFALGIYDDTGALTYEATTDRDIAALGRLRQMGADLSMILSRVEVAMPAGERQLLDALTENARERYINGAKVVSAWGESEEYIEGLSIFVHKLRDYYDSHVTLAAVRCGKKTVLIVRSAPNVLNVQEFLSFYGGSGHLQAGSATLADRDPRELLTELEEKLPDVIPSFVIVKSIMTSPVMAVAPDALVVEAYRTMLRFGHKALPVVRDGEVVGMMTRRDLDKAYLHGFERALIRDFMTEGVIAISAEASLNEAHRQMATYSFEQLPVLEQGRLIGILTRADLLRALYQTYRPGEKETGGGFLWMEGVADLLEHSFPLRVLDLLRRIGEKAESLGMRAYIVGGAVRDILKGKKNVDLDVSVEGDAETLVRAWNEPGCRTVVHGRYKTGTIAFSDGLKVDIATARREFYEYAAAMPEVSSDSLKQDLARRDFSINAMAVSLSANDWGTLTDFYDGRRDLKEGLLRILHNLSFVEDPTRIIRGIRLEQRMGLKFEDNTLRLLCSAIKGGLLEKLSGPRVHMEMEIDFREKLPQKIAIRMRELGVWESFFPGLRFGATAEKRMRRLQRLLWAARKWNVDFRGQDWLTYMAVLLSESTLNVQSAAMDRLSFTPSERKILTDCLAALSPIELFFASKKLVPRNSEVYLFLKHYGLVPLLYCMAAVRRRQTRRWIMRHMVSFSTLKGELTGRDMLTMGYRAGPWIGELLEQIRLERMDGRITGRDDEVLYLRENMLRN